MRATRRVINKWNPRLGMTNELLQGKRWVVGILNANLNDLLLKLWRTSQEHSNDVIIDMVCAKEQLRRAQRLWISYCAAWTSWE